MPLEVYPLSLVEVSVLADAAARNVSSNIVAILDYYIIFVQCTRMLYTFVLCRRHEKFCGAVVGLVVLRIRN